MNDDESTILNHADSGNADANADELTGQLISGRYRVEECLGRGAMGEVYRATHTLMAKTVAIKVLRAQLEHRDDLVERFRREAQAAAHIDHPNICAASDFGQMDDGTFFLVIEYLEGRTIEALIEAEAPVSAARTIEIATEIAAGLSRAHEMDVIHRDLKPENIMLVGRDDGPERVKILDFGVARVRLTEQHENSQLTQAGTVWGTPLYMAPEQAAGGEVDGRSDLYSLGVILYEMLCARPPFKDANPARVMAMHLTHTPEPPSHYAPQAKIPRALEALILEMLDKDPDARPASAALLIERLQTCLTAQHHTPIARRAQDIADRSSTLIKRALSSSESKLARGYQWFLDQTMLTQGALLGGAAVLLLAAVLVPTVLLLSGLSNGDTARASTSIEKSVKLTRKLEDKRADFIKKAGLQDVPMALAEGRTTDALEALEAVDERFTASPHFAYLSGRTNAERGRWQASIDAYQEALVAEPRYANDALLVDDILERFADRSNQRAEPAQAIIEEHLDTEYTTEKLAEIATDGRFSAVRKRAYKLLESTQRLEKLERWHHLSIKMGNTRGCSAYKEVIAEIVEEGDPRALDILKTYSNKSTKGCGFLNLKDCYGCIRGDLRKAIKSLEAAQAKQ